MRTVLIMKKFSVSLVCVAVASCAVSSCSDPVATRGIVATNAVLASIVQEMVGNRAHVETVVPDGKDPHEFQPSAGDIARIAGAAVVVANGFGYEPTLSKAVAQARANGVAVFDAEWAMPGLADPHWFTDPLKAADVMTQLKPVIEKATGLDLDTTFAHAVSEMEATVTEVRSALSGVKGECAYAVEHVLLSPFGDRFSCQGSVVLNTGSRVPDAQPSARDIERFTESIRTKGIRAVVEDVAEPSRVLAQVARQAGVPLVKVNVHGMGDAISYRGYVVAIARAIAGGLG